MNEVIDSLVQVLTKYSLITAFAVIGFTVWVSYYVSERLMHGWLHGSSIAILIGLTLAYIGGVKTGGSRGISDVELFAGIGVLGGTMLRDLAIVSNAFGVKLDEFRKTGWSGVISLLVGVFIAFFIGTLVAYSFGYRDPVSITTIGAGAATFLVGPVTGSALGASSEVIALSITAGLTKSILVMSATPFVAKYIGLNNPRSALIYGGLMGTTSGVTGGLAATDPKLVPYGAMSATFYTGLGCLLGPSIIYLLIRQIV
ncbi:MAG: malonate transporter subunit MadM [Opitutaceae bacterium]|nr:malonate transporter subunit MadM [Opitutaceae bacterium]|tara:strand:- start:8897 stop:9667 length:771 start_codon:yes stop_codon:yes gene_type:complete